MSNLKTAAVLVVETVKGLDGVVEVFVVQDLLDGVLDGYIVDSHGEDVPCVEELPDVFDYVVVGCRRIRPSVWGSSGVVRV